MLLRIENLTAGYGAIPVVHDVDMEIKPGEIIAIIGPNGAGKSTVLKALFGLTEVFSGKTTFSDRNIINMPTHKLLEMGLAFVPQGRIVFSGLTVSENLDMGGYIIKDKDAKENEKNTVYSYFPFLKERRSEKASNLSGGQQQMLALGRALMMTPSCLLLDEPSLGLSPKIIKEVFSKIKEINKKGVSIAIVEQNVHLALEVADRAYILANGRVVATGPAKEFYDKNKLKKLFFGN